MSASARLCKNCEFWEPSKILTVTDGQCHRYPPDQHVQNPFPTTVSTMWCGEFRPMLVPQKDAK